MDETQIAEGIIFRQVRPLVAPRQLFALNDRVRQN